MKVSKLQSNVTVAFDYTYFNEAGDEATERITAQIARLPFRQIADLQQKLGVVTDDSGVLVELIAPLVRSWSLTDDEGKAWPCDADSMLSLPFDFVAALATAVVGKLLPGSTSMPTPENSAIN